MSSRLNTLGRREASEKVKNIDMMITMNVSNV